jgi:hypothetical protein
MNSDSTRRPGRRPVRAARGCRRESSTKRRQRQECALATRYWASVGKKR